MGTNINPLIGERTIDTLDACLEALDGLIGLAADKHSALCRLLAPIVAALEYEATEREHTSRPDERGSVRGDTQCVSANSASLDQNRAA